MASTRRMVLFGGLGAAGALVVGYALWPSGRIGRIDKLDAKPGEKFVTNWIKISKDDSVTVVIPHCDMGTGIYTSLPQMAAEELDADWDKVRVEAAPADVDFANGAMAEGFALNGKQVPDFLKGITANTFRTLVANFSLPGIGYIPQITGGSSAVRFTGVMAMRVTGAAAREMLVKAAAARWNVSPDTCSTKHNRVIHAASGRSFGYGELAEDAAGYSPSSNPPLKPKSQYMLVGKSIPRIDIPTKVNGETHYGLDVKVPGMAYAAIKISPVFGGKLKAVEVSDVLKRRGVQKVVQLDDAVVVVADRFWRARDAVAALNPVFDNGVNGHVTSADITAGRASAMKGDGLKSDLKVGNGAGALSGGKPFEATYHVPYLAHAPMEPVNATALFKDGKLEVWAGTQDGLGSRGYCAKVAGIPMDDVTFHLQPLGGSFGRRLPGLYNFFDYAVRTAMAVPGTPVKLIFTREEDIQHDYYRPNVMSRFRAALDAKGMPVAWVNDYVGDEGANPEAHIVYEVPNQAISAAQVKTHVPTGPWRSVEASWHGFFIESFIDELAHEAKADPAAYRLSLLKDHPRHAAVIRTAAKAAGWGATPLATGQGLGIAMFECFQTIVCHVVDLTVSPDGQVKVNRVVCAVDCGSPVNPDGLKAQMEGGIIYGLTAALNGAITIDKGAVMQANFPDYEMVRLADCPQIEVHVVESDAALGGAGEPGTPPIA
ncbi:MAG TPA: molybdopterin cofactor-binding domain-containing protein, partial [Rhizomicrobium sp.]|nr:molybdopterin cofactor-binding domain-containing protein [Rhizomicrobium sp.]